MAQENDIMKVLENPIVIPIVTMIMSSLFAFIIASNTTRKEQKNLITNQKLNDEKNKIEVTNQWLLNSIKAISVLENIKSSYLDKLGKDPTQRTFSLENKVSHKELIDTNVASLTFILAKKDEMRKWNNLLEISLLMHNYNELLISWEKFFLYKEKIMIEVDKEGKILAKPINSERVTSIFGQQHSSALVSLAENNIKNTNILLRKFDEFVRDLPTIARERIDIELAKKTGLYLIDYRPSEELTSVISRDPPNPDHEKLAKLLGKSIEQVKKIYH